MKINKNEMLKIAKEGIRKELTSPDQRIIALSLLSEKVPNNLNELFEALRIITDLEYPMLDSILSIKEYCLVYNLEEVNEKTLEKVGLDKKRIKQITTIIDSEVGIKFSEKEKKLTKSLSSNILNLIEIKEVLAKEIEKLLIETYPTFTKVASSAIATKMLIISGGIARLSRFPASTIQLLGSEKSFFKALAQNKNTPKYGILFNHPLIISLPAKQKGKIARIIASKIAIGIKSDLGGKDISKELLEKINYKIKHTKWWIVMGRILNPRPKPKKFGMEKVQQKIIEKKLKDSTIEMHKKSRIENCVYSEWLIGENDNRLYSRNRGYPEYNNMIKYLKLGDGLENKEILQVMVEYSIKNKKKVMKVLDDGAGRGVFLSDLKEMWETFRKMDTKNPKLETTAIVLNKKDLKRAKIDKVYVGDVSKYVPKEKFDFIFSVFGGFAHSTPHLQREILLKHLYSLEKGGYGFFGFFSEHKKEYADAFTKKLSKMGFEAKYHNFKKENNPGMNVILIGENLPREYLVVKRIK